MRAFVDCVPDRVLQVRRLDSWVGIDLDVSN